MSCNDEKLAGFSNDDIEAVLVREILAASTYKQHSAPTAVLLAGQPGAGKTVLSDMLMKTFHGDAYFINADEYRRFHPNYRELYNIYGANSVRVTGKFSSAVTERLIQELSELRINLIVEGTGRTTEVPHRTAELLVGEGYRVELSAIAVRPEISLCSTLLRFYEMHESGTIPRATARDDHDYVVKVLPGNLDILSEDKFISRLTIWTRALSKIYDSGRDAIGSGDALLQCWNDPWSDAEIQYAKNMVFQLFEKEDITQLGQRSSIEELEQRIAAVVKNQEPGISFDMMMG